MKKPADHLTSTDVEILRKALIVQRWMRLQPETLRAMEEALARDPLFSTACNTDGS